MGWKFQILHTQARGLGWYALAEFVYYRTYSRWIEDEGRREIWVETVSR